MKGRWKSERELEGHKDRILTREMRIQNNPLPKVPSKNQRIISISYLTLSDLLYTYDEVDYVPSIKLKTLDLITSKL